MISIPHRSACACVLALLLFQGCAGSRPDPQWLEAPVESVNENILWRVTVEALQKTGFPLGTGLDQSHLHAVSGWDTHLAPFRGDGFRERCTIELVPKSGVVYEARVRVERERNMDIVHPLDLSYAEWEQDPDDTDRARLVLGYMKAMLGPAFELKSTEKPRPKAHQ